MLCPIHAFRAPVNDIQVIVDDVRNTRSPLSSSQPCTPSPYRPAPAMQTVP